MLYIIQRWKMHKTSMINTRIDPSLKAKAETILQEIGLTPAEAVRLFYTQVCLQRGLPFEVKIPSKTTIKAMKAADLGKTRKSKSVKDILREK